MARGRVGLVALLFVLCTAVATACAGEDGGDGVHLSWQGPDGEQIRLDQASPGMNAPLIRTFVYVTNTSDATLRDARLRFGGAAGARNAPAGFSVGTVANVSSRFEGDDQVWPVGDLAPGAKVAVPLSLWFEVAVQATQSHPVELTLSLVSPDLDAVVVSNALKVSLQ